MCFADEPVQVGRGAVFRIDAVVVAHGVGAAERALGLELPNRVDRHQPQDVDAELLESIELRRDAGEVTRGRELARKDLVDDALAHPDRAGPRRQLRIIRRLACAGGGDGELRQGQRDRQHPGRGPQCTHVPAHGSPHDPDPTLPSPCNIHSRLRATSLNTYAPWIAAVEQVPWQGRVSGVLVVWSTAPARPSGRAAVRSPRPRARGTRRWTGTTKVRTTSTES